MVLLSSSVRQSNAQPLKLQALEGWQALVKALTKEAPHQLADVANQVPQHTATIIRLDLQHRKVIRPAIHQKCFGTMHLNFLLESAMQTVNWDC